MLSIKLKAQKKLGGGRGGSRGVCGLFSPETCFFGREKKRGLRRGELKTAKRKMQRFLVGQIVLRQRSYRGLKSSAGGAGVEGQGEKKNRCARRDRCPARPKTSWTFITSFGGGDIDQVNAQREGRLFWGRGEKLRAKILTVSRMDKKNLARSLHLALPKKISTEKRGHPTVCSRFGGTSPSFRKESIQGTNWNYGGEGRKDQVRGLYSWVMYCWTGHAA